MPEPKIEIQPHEAAHVLAVLGDGSFHPGNFITKLIEAVCVADHQNQDRLALGFPGYVGAVQIFKFEPQGVERLQAIAEEYR